MNVKLFFYGTALLSLGLFYSCREDDSVLSEQKTTENQEIFEQTIKFEGEVYHVRCTMQNDSLVYLDKDFEALYKNRISQIPELTTFVYKNQESVNIIEYYSSEKELLEKKGLAYFNIESSPINNTRAGEDILPAAGRAILYDDTNYKDRTVTLNVDYDRYPSIANLKAYAGFNDKTSAIRVFNFLNPNTYYRPSYAYPSASVKGSELRTCLIGYEDSNFQGKKLFCIAEYSSGQNIDAPETASHQDYKLRNIGWNDKISSCVFRIITIGNINDGVYTPHDPV